VTGVRLELKLRFEKLPQSFVVLFGLGTECVVVVVEYLICVEDAGDE
jgi:hypothetical protein